MEEIWKDITDYEGIYRISNYGRILSLKSNKETILKPVLYNIGYYVIGLSKNKKRKFILLHRLIAEAFIQNTYNKPYVNHINGIKTDNRIENLEWCTASENCKHAFSIKIKSANGEKNSRSKLTNSDVIDIRNSILKQTELAKIYNVGQNTISKIITKRTWSHI